MPGLLRLPLLLALAWALSPPSAAERRVVCRGIGPEVCAGTNGQMGFSDGCRYCRCSFRRAKCSPARCPPEAPEDREKCDRLREVFRQKQEVRKPCLTPEVVCPERGDAIFYRSCNQCQCRGKSGRCDTNICPDNIGYTDRSYRIKCRRARFRVIGLAGDKYRYMKRALYI